MPPDAISGGLDSQPPESKTADPVDSQDIGGVTTGVSTILTEVLESQGQMFISEFFEITPEERSIVVKTIVEHACKKISYLAYDDESILESGLPSERLEEIALESFLYITEEIENIIIRPYRWDKVKNKFFEKLPEATLDNDEYIILLKNLISIGVIMSAKIKNDASILKDASDQLTIGIDGIEAIAPEPHTLYVPCKLTLQDELIMAEGKG